MSGDDVPKPYVTVDFGTVELPTEETDGAHKSRPSDETLGTSVNLDFLTNSQGNGSANNASPQHGDSMHHLPRAIISPAVERKHKMTFLLGLQENRSQKYLNYPKHKIMLKIVMRKNS